MQQCQYNHKEKHKSVIHMIDADVCMCCVTEILHHNYTIRWAKQLIFLESFFIIIIIDSPVNIMIG